MADTSGDQKLATQYALQEQKMMSATSKTVSINDNNNDEKTESINQSKKTSIPVELQKNELHLFSMRDLYNIHLEDASDISNGHEPRSTSFMNSATIRSVGVIDDEDLKQDNQKNQHNFYQLVFDIKHCIFKAGNDTKLLFSIYDDTDKRVVTEEYCLHLSENNFPKVGSPEDCKVLFKNLPSDIMEHELFIICRIYRIGPMEAPDVSNNKKDNKKKKGKSMNELVRPFAATVIRLKEHIPKLMNSLGEEVNFEPGEAKICCPKEESSFAALIFDLIDADNQSKNIYYIAPLSIGIAHGLTLYGGDASIVEKEYSFYDKLTEVEPLIINPLLHIEKHVLYVTVLDAHVNQRSKRAACNVCLRMQLRDNTTYKAVPGVMMLGKGKMAVPESETVSPVYYHQNDPIINQTYHVLIPSDIGRLSNTHLYFQLFHMPATNKKPDERGFAYINLFSSKLKQLTANNEYELPIYRHDKKTLSGGYLDNEGLKSENKAIRVFFQLSSTKIYSNIDVHHFLTWKEHKIASVVAAVKRVARQPFTQLLTILDELMNCIFTIFQESDDAALIDQTYATLIGVLGEANKNTNIKYKPRIEEWIEYYFKYSKVWRILSTQQSRLLQWIASAEAVDAQAKDAATALKQRSAEMIRKLQNQNRGVKYLFNIMKKSAMIEIAENDDQKEEIEAEYNRQIQALFSSMNRVMGLKQPKTVAGVQSFALRNFLSLLDSVPTQTSKELTQTLVKFINSIHNQGVNNSVEKLLLIRRCLEHPKLKRVDIVTVLLPSICKSLNYHMNQSMDEKAACATVLQKCIQFLDPKRPRSVIGDDNKRTFIEAENPLVIPSQELYDQFSVLLLKLFGILDQIRDTDLAGLVSVQKIFGKQLKKNKQIPNANNNLTKGVIVSEDQLRVHRDFFITIADLSHVIMSASTENENEEAKQWNILSWGEKCDRIDRAITTLRKENENDAVNVIESALKCCNNILISSLFKGEWVIMRMVEAEIAMRGLSWFGSTLKRNYLSKSFLNGQHLWKQWLRLGMIYLWHEDFALEDMDKRRADIISTKYGDVRKIAIKKLSVAWNVLTPHRAALADTMIKAAVEASASEVGEIQEFAVDVYFQMIRSEYDVFANIQSVETHTIDQIDLLTAKYSHKEHVINRYLDFFRIHVQTKLDETNDENLKKIGSSFLSDIERLYGYLVKLKKLPNNAEYEDERTSATLLLLEYLNSSGKNELYNRYIHHLATMHQSLGNHIEAAICFKSHGDRLGWSDSIKLAEEPLVGLSESFEWKRHVNLYELAHKHFMLGEHWEMGVSVCQELANAYQHQIFDLSALSSILEKESQLWKLIANHDRVFHSCYLVKFKNVSQELHNVSFVYRSGNGKTPETVRDFTDRIKKKYQNAKVVNSAAHISTFDDKNEPFIQITTLSPSSTEELDGDDFKWEQSIYKKAPLRMKKYYRENETSTFFYTNAVQKKKNKKDNEFRSLWITKTFIVCEDSIPSMRRRVPVISEKIVEYTPFQTAINNLAGKNEEVLKIIERLENDPQKSTNDISMNLNGILDAAVMGGVAKYREAFFDGTYLTEHPKEVAIVQDFEIVLREQMAIAKDALDAYEKYAIDALQPHIDHLKTCYKKQNLELNDFYSQIKEYKKF